MAQCVKKPLSSQKLKWKSASRQLLDCILQKNHIEAQCVIQGKLAIILCDVFGCVAVGT